MTQTIVLNKFIKFLNFKRKELKNLLESEEKIPEKQQQQIKQTLLDLGKLQQDFSKGHCFAFSLCYSSMAYLGKAVLAWWEALLCAIAAWDETEEALTREVTLPPLPHVKNAPTTLTALITKALDYIKLHQTDSNHEDNRLIFEDQKEGVVHQRIVLEPNRGFFELLDNAGNLKKITHRECAAGNFTDEQLERLLEEKYINGFICLLHNSSHALSLSYFDSQWRLYDPNYPHEPEKIHQTFTTKKELIKNLRCILGTSIAIEVASLEPSQQSHIEVSYRTMINESGTTLFCNHGLILIALLTPVVLDKMLLNDAATEPSCCAHVAQGVIEKTSDNWTGLHMVARYAPAALGRVLDYAARAPAGCARIANTLVEKTQDGWTGLNMIARYAPAQLTKAFTLVSQAENGAELILKILATKTAEGKNNWQAIKSQLSSYQLYRLKKHIVDQFSASIRDHETAKKLKQLLTNPTESDYQNLCVKQGFFSLSKPTKISQTLLGTLNRRLRASPAA